MAKNIADALTALSLVQAAVTASVGGVTFTTARVWKYPPPASAALADTPAWINTWRVEPRTAGASSLRGVLYVVRSQLFIGDVDIDRGIEVATRMHMDYADRLDHNVTLKDAGGVATVSRLNWRGADPTIGTAERNGISYQVLDMFEELLIQGGFAYS